MAPLLRSVDGIDVAEPDEVVVEQAKAEAGVRSGGSGARHILEEVMGSVVRRRMGIQNARHATAV